METYTIYQAREILSEVQSVFGQPKCGKCEDAIEHARRKDFNMKLTEDTGFIHFMVDERTSS